MDKYLVSSDVIDWRQPDVVQLARRLANDAGDMTAVVRRCFECVRDEIEHSVDFRRSEITCRASEVLAAHTGFCYAKSHLLAALLRANGIPAALCYQRLSIDGTGAPFCLHGLNAVFLPEHGWYRIDARGNKSGVDAQFTPPVERLAFAVQLPGEANLSGLYGEPLAAVRDVLRRYDSVEEVAANLPDVPLDESRALALQSRCDAIAVTKQK
jgi:transglutaminase-like putative cysteine protease